MQEETKEAAEAVAEAVEAEAVEHAAMDAEVAPEPAKKTKPASAPAQASAATAEPYAVVGKGPRDVVHADRCVYKNPATRKSLTVHHLQRRLTELGYSEAAADKDGWYGDLTKSAVAAWQKATGRAVTGLIADAFELAALFEGDPNVEVALPN